MTLFVLASLGWYQVPHAVLYQHPEIVFRAFFRPDLRQIN
jgi:hypothetical protein